MDRVSQLVLPMLPAKARSVGPSAGLLEGPDGGVVFVLGLATYTFALADEAGRRLAAVQLVTSKIASAQEVASAFGVSGVTLWTWRRNYATGGVAGLFRGQTGPKGAIKLTETLTARIIELDAAGLTLLKIAARTGVSTATVRVALGRVAPTIGPTAPAVELGTACQDAMSDDEEEDDDCDQEQDDDAGWAEDLEERDPTDPTDPTDVELLVLPELVVLAPPVPRTAERVAARFGDLVEAPVLITEGAQLPLAGLLLALPALGMTGLLPVAAQTFGPLRKGFYGLRVILLMGVFMALLRQPRAEGATRMPPADLGRVLGLDRAPEVKTLRRKLSELASLGRGAQLQAALGAHHVKAHPDAVGFLYLDGHVRVYSGSRQLPKTHIARMRIAGPATEETWVGDSEGDPVMVITAAPSQSLAAELHRLLPELRALIGPDRRCTLVFDRGGYSPQVFAEIIAADMDLLTYYKGAWSRAAVSTFTTVDYLAPDGSSHTFELAQRPITLKVPRQPATEGKDAVPAGTVTLRLIIRRSPDGHQTPILTNRTDLTAAEICYRMGNRWRQENYFKYGRENFALDALDSYADHPDDLTRLVPNPAKHRAKDKVKAARKDLTDAHAGVADALDSAVVKAGQPGNDGKALVDPAAGLTLNAAQLDLAEAKKASRKTPSHLPLGQVRPGSRLLETERKLLTHAIRMSAYNTESALARLLRPHYARSEDEGRALLREAFTLSGDLQVIGGTLHVRLNPASAPRRSKAIAALCTELNDTNTLYPGTALTLHYSVKGHPNPA
jgi:prepilin-type processing-associated H-X9-DG protein